MKRRPHRRKTNPVARVLSYLAWTLGLFLAASVVAVVALKWCPPPTTAFMLQSSFDALRKGEQDIRYRYSWVAYDEISPFLKIAVVAAEDQSFPEHHGFDIAAIQAALEQSKQGKRLRGASTISQQLAKNLFLWPGRNMVRKGLEAYFTVLLEAFVSKRRILEIYLNVAQFGDNVFGAGAASTVYLAKPAAAISATEAALFAAVLPNPRVYRLDRPSPRVLRRQQWIRRQMRQLGGIKYLEHL